MTRMVPPAVLLVPIFGIWKFQFQIDGTRMGIILIYVAMNLPFVIWILQSFIVQVPIQLEESASIDGAGMLLAIPPIIFTFVASRQIITGMTAGAVKG